MSKLASGMVVDAVVVEHKRQIYAAVTRSPNSDHVTEHLFGFYLHISTPMLAEGTRIFRSKLWRRRERALSSTAPKHHQQSLDCDRCDLVYRCVGSHSETALAQVDLWMARLSLAFCSV
jgi:hypothetical protein